MTAEGSGGTLQTGSTEELSEPLHQSLKDLLAYWLSKKGERMAPPRSAINPADIVRHLPTIAIINVTGDPPRFSYRLFGTALAEAYGQDLTGRFLDEVDLDHISLAVLRQVEKVVREGCVSVHRDSFTKRDGRYLEYERICLPLSDDGRIVNMILIGHFIEKAFGTRLVNPS